MLAYGEKNRTRGKKVKTTAILDADIVVRMSAVEHFLFEHSFDLEGMRRYWRNNS